ncbi:MAG TPA: acetolactate synthase catalytic subunit [Clostridiaceae bacterium]|nr:acetolactate synthase catalytic subunit [Clostridiaceae bacterium]
MTHELIEMTNADYMAYALKKNGVEHIFGLSNPSNIVLSCMEQGIQQICFRQENAGSYMAQGYGMMTGKVPIVTAQNGPAATLLVPGLAECLTASHPIVAIVQQVGLQDYDKNAFQELNHEKLFDGCAKWIGTIMSADRIADYVDMAFTQAASGRPGPAVLLCPVSIFNDKKKYKREILRTKNLGHYPLDRYATDYAKIKEAAKMIAEAEQPIIIAGGGVMSSKAESTLQDLQEKCSIPVATTMMGKGAVDENHPLSMGVTGYISGKRGMSKFLRPTIESADLIVLVGTRTNQNGTDSWTLFSKDSKFIHIDMDGAEIGRNYEAFRLLGDAKLTLKMLTHALLEEDLNKRHDNRANLENLIKEAKLKHIEEAKDVAESTAKPIRIETFTKRLDNYLEDDHVIVADASFSSIWLANYLTATKNRKFIFPRGLAGLGWGLPMAMGAKVAAPNRKVFCLAGDGGFAFVWGEIEALKRNGIDVVCAVINNEVLGYQYWAELAKFDGRYTNACELGPVDHTKIAEACGIKGIRLEDPAKIDEVIEEALNFDGSVIIDIMADPDSVPPVRLMEPFDGDHYTPQFFI